LAVLCFQNQCYPALVGADTPTGKYELHQRLTDTAGYGGDVLQFHETQEYVFAIHRTYLLNKAEHRDQRIKSKDPAVRHLTRGCINVDPVVYEKLRDCCSNDTLTINP
jgi:hypothetical protein